MALELNGSYIGSRYINVTLAKGESTIKGIYYLLLKQVEKLMNQNLQLIVKLFLLEIYLMT